MKAFLTAVREAFFLDIQQMMDKEHIDKTAFEVGAFHADFSGQLTWAFLGNHLLNASGWHAEKRRFRTLHIDGKEYTWVLSRLVIEMERMPRQNETFYIETWIESVYRLFTDRCYRLTNEAGEVLGYGKAVWAMIDTEERKPIDLMQIDGGRLGTYVCHEPCPIEKFGRVKLGTPILTATHPTVYSDIDINGHVNSIKYIEHILNLFPLNVFKERSLHRFEIAYMAESYYGDTLQLAISSEDADTYVAEIRKNNEETVVRSKIVFKEK